MVRKKCRRFSNNKVMFPGSFLPFVISWQSIGLQRLTLHMTAFIPLQIFLYFGKISTMQNPSISLLVLYMQCFCSAWILQGQGCSFCLYSKADFKLHLWTTSCWGFWHSSATQSCSWKSRLFFFPVVWWKCYNSKADHACILHLHSLSYAPLQKIKQLFMASLGVVTQTEHSELAALKNLSACTKYGKLGSMQNFQMGKSSSMCSWERDVNSIPEKVNDALT